VSGVAVSLFDHARGGTGPRAPAWASRPGCQDLTRRLRHRLILAESSVQLPVRQDRDRPLLRETNSSLATTLWQSFARWSGSARAAASLPQRRASKMTYSSSFRREGCTQAQRVVSREPRHVGDTRTAVRCAHRRGGV